MDANLSSRVKQAHMSKQRRGGGKKGGGKKRCKRGKSCGATCINSSKVCLVGIPMEISMSIGKVARKVISLTTKGEQRKARIRELLSQTELQSLSKSKVNSAIKSLSDYINSDPANNNRANRDALLSLRALRAKVSATERSAEGLKSPPKGKSTEYSKTPGSSKPIPFLDKAQAEERLNKEIADLNARIKKLSAGDDESDEIPTLLKAKSALTSQLYAVQNDYLVEIGLGSIYKLQGYNSEPEMVPTRSDLEKSGKVLKNSDGSSVILYRGVSDGTFADQFKGKGPQGGVHYPGEGMYGNGTYAASAPDIKAGSTVKKSYIEAAAIDTAKSYANDQDFNRRVIAFSLRSDANVLQFNSMDDFHQWESKVVKEASKETGYRFTDAGAAAAALGIHAYRFTRTGSLEDYWVILNRGAVIAADDPEL